MKALAFSTGQMASVHFLTKNIPGTVFEQNLYFLIFIVPFAFAVILWCE